MFFTQDRPHFFRPLTSKYREIIVECLRLLYLRMFSSMADYGHALKREQMLEILLEALTRAPELEALEPTAEGEGRIKTDRERANWILNLLIEHAWLEVQVDDVALQSNYQFTRLGRLFTQPFVELSGGSVRTRHRNTRNTKNALRAFLSDGEVHDLLDAYEFSERIVSDFTDIITELEDRKRQLVQEVEVQALIQRASDEFFDFMDKRFQPDLSVRLSADSVERHREDIHGLIEKIRHWPKDKKAESERKLRLLLPDQVRAGQSLLWMILDHIDTRLTNACEVMIPALRSALRNFTRRADIIIRQMSYLASQKHNDVVQVCQELNQLPEDVQQSRLNRAGDILANLHLGLIDPAATTLREGRAHRHVETEVMDDIHVDESARRELYVQQALDTAFVINDENTRQYLIKALGSGNKINTKDLPIAVATDLLAASHAIELGAVSNLSSEFSFSVEPLQERVEGEYMQSDGFIIELKT